MSKPSERWDIYVFLFLLILIIGLFYLYILSYDKNLEEKADREFNENHFKSDLKLHSSGNIVFTGYSDYSDEGCSISLKTNSLDVSFKNDGYYPPIATYKDGQLYIAKYIKQYTSKAFLYDYIITCDQEIFAKQLEQKSNVKSWE